MENSPSHSEARNSNLRTFSWAKARVNVPIAPFPTDCKSDCIRSGFTLGILINQNARIRTIQTSRGVVPHPRYAGTCAQGFQNRLHSPRAIAKCSGKHEPRKRYVHVFYFRHNRGNLRQGCSGGQPLRRHTVLIIRVVCAQKRNWRH